MTSVTNHTELSDEQLFSAYHTGDMAAFESLYARYRQSMYLFLLRRGLNESSAEDVYHDTWIKVLEQTQFKHNNFKAWLYTVMRNLSIDALRKSSIRVVEEFDESVHDEQSHVSAQKQTEDNDCLDLMTTSITQLPFEQRDAFLLQHEAGLSLQQIAEVMSTGKETIKSRLRYAMNSLKQWLEECL